MTDFNAQIIEEFRANDGKLSGNFAQMQVVLVHHKGRKSGIERVNPLAYQKVDGGWAVFGSFAGAPHHPDWYLNLLANPRTAIEIGTETIEVVARDTSGAEREAIYAHQKETVPIFAEYEQKAGSRVIPVIVLEPVH